MSQGLLPLQTDRIAAQPNLSVRTALKGQVPAWASQGNDQGPVLADTPLRVTFVLARSQERQAAFAQLLLDQQNDQQNDQQTPNQLTPGTSKYHQWLTPQQVGELYGPTQHDLDSLTTWLLSQGLTLVELAPSRVFLTVSGSASALGTTLGTNFHTFSDHGKLRQSITVDPTVPTTFSPLIASISGLVGSTLQPMHQLQALPMSARAAGHGSVARPQLTITDGSHYLTPADFGKIFDVKSTNTGTGQKVAIIGRSRVATSDISEYETAVGITPQNLPNTIVPPTGVDPGITGTGDQGEATLDVDRVIGTAPQVQADLVVSSSAGGYDGIAVAAQYEVQTLLDPVMTISFGACEAYAGPGNVSFWDTLFSQAASEGISVFVSSADSGAATCDTQFSAPPDYQLLSINSICASSYATCVGGTELVEGANPSQYWSTTNGTNLESALGYISEGAWNEPYVTAPFSSSGFYVSPYVVAATGGGASVYVPKPAWQVGVGVPADGARDVPDISFPAAAHDGYFSCYAAAGGDCANNRFVNFYGTSAAAPAMAGVAALLNQKAGSAQGNFNPLLYRIAASTPAAFHDATPASSGVGANCLINTPSFCNNSLPGSTALQAGLEGYALTVGYDQATGLGSLDVSNFLTAAAAGTQVALAATSLTLRGSAATITDLQTAAFTTVLASKIAGTPTGSVQFFANGDTLGAPVTLVAGAATTPALPFTAAGSYYISATYSGDTSYAAAIAPGTSLVVSGQTALVTTSVASSLVTVGTQTTFGVSLAPASGSTVPTGVVRFYASTSTGGRYVATELLANGRATTSALVFSWVGAYRVTAFYLGDSIFSPASSSAIYSVQKMPTQVQLSTSVGTAGVGGYKSFGISVNDLLNSSDPAETGTVQLLANGVALGTPVTVTGTFSPAFQLAMMTVPGTAVITGVYSGDGYHQTSTSMPLTIVVGATPAGYQLVMSTPTLTFAGGASTANTNLLTINPSNGFAGPISLACAVTSNGSGAVTSPPTCSLHSSSLVTMVDSASPSTLVTINTTHSSATRADSSHPGIGEHLGLGGVALCAMLVCLLPRRRRVWSALALCILFGAGFTMLSGCSGGSSATPAPPPISGTTAGAYTVTITPSSTGALTTAGSPVSFALTVQ